MTVSVGPGAHPGDTEASSPPESAAQGDLLSMPSLLWPSPSVATVGRPNARSAGAPVAEFLVIPSAARPRLLVPARPRRAAAAAVRRYSDGVSRFDQVTRRVLSLALGTGIVHRTFRDRVVISGAAGSSATDSIESYLREVLGQDLVVSLAVGPVRANRKPVLQVLSPSGATLGYAKVGHNALTRQLVRDEAMALRTLADARLSTTRVPELLHHGQWRDFEVLVLSALPTGSLRRRSFAPPLRAMREIAAVGHNHETPLGESTYYQRLLAAADELSLTGPGGALHGVLELVAKHADQPLSFGTWHGDWTPWNMSWQRDSVLLWDWERFDDEVPLGFDVLHFRIQSLLRHHGPDNRHAVGPDFAGSADALLRQFGLPAADTSLVTVLYLLSIYLRYASDADGDGGDQLRALAAWVLSQLEEQGRRL